MNIDITIIMYSYLFICFSLLIYNIGYIFYLKFYKKFQDKHSLIWHDKIKSQMDYLEYHQHLEPYHHKTLNKLVRTKELLTFIEALETLKNHPQFNNYIDNIYINWQLIALKYAKKDNMNKAFFAYVIATYPPNQFKDEFSPIIQILLSYFDNNSSIYCRENVLNALYALGNIQAIENAFQLLNDHQWFHHQKLLSDGLAKFNGNKEELMAKLWSHLGDWDSNLMVSTIQFISQCNGPYQETFLPILKSNKTPLEIRLAIIRYYRLHPFLPAKHLLYSFIQDNEADENLTIVSAFALEAYKCSETIRLLKEALHHHNWYVRYNSAKSLFNMNISLKSLEDISNGEDRFAREILEYIYEKEEHL